MTTLLFTHPASLAHAMPPGHPECADRIKAVELEAERVLQEALFASLPPSAKPPSGDVEDCARHNLAAYEAATGVRLPPEAAAILVRALAGSVPDANA